MIVKRLKYYLSLDYDVTISRMEEEGEVGYKAYSRDLDSFVFYGAGDTKLEALESFEETKRELFELYLEEGRDIPEPTREDDTLPSGRFVLRIDPKIHWKLTNHAKEARKSLNSYVDQILISHVTGKDLLASLLVTAEPGSRYMITNLETSADDRGLKHYKTPSYSSSDTENGQAA